jgi:hypothetical protein
MGSVGQGRVVAGYLGTLDRGDEMAREELNEDLIKWRYTNKRTGENRYDLKDRRGHYANKNRLTGK